MPQMECTKASAEYKINFFKLTSNWEPKNCKNILDAISLKESEEHDAEKGVSLEEIVSFNSCVQLEKLEEKNSCCLEITIDDENKSIRNITVITESKFIEVYVGSLKEYYATYTSELIDDFDGLAVYKAEIRFSSPVQQCSLMLPKSILLKEIWLYGINLVLEKMSNENNPESANFNALSQILKYNKMKIPPSISMLQTFLAMQLEDKRNSEILAGSQGVDPRTPINSVDSTQSINLNMLNDIATIKLKEYIDEKFLTLEKNIVEKFQQRIDHIDHEHGKKLDEIMSILRQNILK